MNDRNFILQDTEYERLERISTTMLVSSVLISPAEASEDTDTKASETEIIFALGFIVTLVISSFFLLYRCLDSTPANLNTNKSKLSTAFINRGWGEKDELQYGWQTSNRFNKD